MAHWLFCYISKDWAVGIFQGRCFLMITRYFLHSAKTQSVQATIDLKPTYLLNYPAGFESAYPFKCHCIPTLCAVNRYALR